MARETSQTLDRGLTVLELLGRRPDGMTVNELANALGVGRTVVYRLVATLEDHALVRRDSEGKVRLWLGVVPLARAVQPLLRGTALPVLRRLADDVGATAHLTVADGAESLAVAVVEPARSDLHVAYREGARHPMDKGAAGRALLRLREGNPGLVASVGELQSGAHGIAAPVMGVPGVEASVGVVVLGPLDPAVVGPMVLAAAADLALLLAPRARG
ncbi:MAG: helix-turn-helix domain-containing protein [Actinomycetes bacterium]